MADLCPDLNQAKHFLKILDPGADFNSFIDGGLDGFTFQTFDDLKDRKDGRLARVLNGTFELQASYLSALNRKGAGIFVTVNKTDLSGRTLEHLLKVRAVWIEHDAGEEIPTPLEPHLVTETSKNKYHKLFLVEDLTFEQHSQVQEVLIADYGSDPNAKDLARVLRLPGFYHCKGKPHRVNLLQALNKPPYSSQEILKAFNVGSAVALSSNSSHKSVATSRRHSSDPEEYIPISEADSKLPIAGITLENAAQYFPDPSSVTTRKKWLDTGMSLHHQFHGSSEALQLYDVWSQKVYGYKGFDDVAREWSTLGKRTNGEIRTFGPLIWEFNQKQAKKDAAEHIAVTEKAKKLLSECDDYMVLVNSVAPKLWNLTAGNLVLQKDFASGLMKRYTELRPGEALTKTEAVKLLKKKTAELVVEPPGDIGYHNPRAPEWCKNWVWVSTEEVFFNTATRVHLKSLGFRGHYDSHLPRSEDGPKDAAFWVRDNGYIPKVMRTMYAPSFGTFFTYSGVTCVNSYSNAHSAKIPETVQNPKAVEIFKKHIELVFGGWNREAQLFVNWLATCTGSPPIKVRWAPLLIGSYGDGKGVFYSFVASALGVENTRVINASTIMASATSGQTGWAEGHAFGMVEEIKWHGHNKHDAMNAMKPYITNDVVACKQMHREVRNIPNTANYFIQSNYKDCVPLSDGDRRYFVWFSKLQVSELPKDYFKLLFKVVTQYTGDLICWLRSAPVHADFDVNGVAPITDDKKAMVLMTTNDFDDEIKDILDSSAEPYYGSQVVCFNHLFRRALISSDGGIKPGEQYKLSRMLVALGYLKLGRIRISGRQESVWVKDRSMCVEAAKALVEERLYNREQSGVDYESDLM